jgi:hypothetical protein
VKLPLRLTGLGVLKLLDGALTLGMKVDEWLRERKQREPKGMTFKDVQNIEKQIASATARRSAPTVIIPRAKK